MDRDAFEAAPASRRGSVKTTLTDQPVLAGPGNLLADEILWRAGLRPSASVSDLTEADRRHLHVVPAVPARVRGEEVGLRPGKRQGGRTADAVRPPWVGGRYEIRTREGLPPTRFPPVVVGCVGVFGSVHLGPWAAGRPSRDSSGSRMNVRERC
ncbi:hypothetical protein ACFY2T_24085 [Streptomyces sp. NPDC001260]|uniref:hypothetical protein n=1 Tax=Streptomyces sp. NPDC001260 TaxID=3364551 RepID=UPI00369D9304